MTALLKILLDPKRLNLVQSSFRYLSSSEVSSALRPFYFSVHPDLFGQHPNQRAINENSLKQLSNFLQCVQTNRPVSVTNLKFYVRKRTDRDEFKLITISLNPNNIRSTIVSILKSCDLSTSFIDNVSNAIPHANPRPTFKERNNFENEFSKAKEYYKAKTMQEEIEKDKAFKYLKTWLDDNIGCARERAQAGRPMQDEVNKLRKSLCKELLLHSIEWDCGWNINHFRGCLKAFEVLTKLHPFSMITLKGRTVVFAPFTGVSLDGHVMLNSAEVRHNWLDLIKNVPKEDAVLLRIPAFEKALSTVLLDIKVVRRKFMPKVMAKEYENNLLRVTTSLNDYTSFQNYPTLWPESLKNYKIVVETMSGPLMLSPTGQFIVPSSCPASLLVNFISENLSKATKRLEEYNTNKHIEYSLHKETVNILGLKSLHKDDSITPELMIPCCQQLLKHAKGLYLKLTDQRLFITTYYSVMTDGVICIPWNWKY